MKTAICILLAWCIAYGACLSYVELRDEDLLGQSTHVIVGTVAQVIQPWRTTYAHDGTPSWSISEVNYEVEVEKTVKGAHLPRRVVIVVPGGMNVDVPKEAEGNLDRVSLSILHGAPQFIKGERVLLFCVPYGGHHNQTGEMTLGIAQLFLGAFHEMRVENGLALRSLDVNPDKFLKLDTTGNVVQADKRDTMAARDFQKFAAWLSDSTEGFAREPDYWTDVQRDTLDHSLSARYTFLADNNGRVFRWNQFATTTVNWVGWPSTGLPNVAGGGTTQMTTSFNNWNNDAGSTINYNFQGNTAPSAGSGFGSGDGRNTILWTDSNNEITPAYACASGGVLGRGGPKASGTHIVNGVTYWTNYEGDIAIQDGISCWTDYAGSAGIEALLTHEIGHTLGFGHSCGDTQSPACSPGSALDNAVMRASIKNGRDGSLGSDDIAVALALYQAAPCSPTTSCAAQGRVCGSISNGCTTVSCGSCTSPATCTAAGQCVCTPTTSCAAQGRTCGSINNGCTTVNCGSCTSPATCNAAGQCACTPTTSCAAQGRVCGSINNGCTTVSCGGCTSPETCTGAGQCVCTPTTSCAAQGRTCGSINNGCTTVSCGTCLTGQTCTGGQCITDPPATTGSATTGTPSSTTSTTSTPPTTTSTTTPPPTTSTTSTSTPTVTETGSSIGVPTTSGLTIGNTDDASVEENQGGSFPVALVSGIGAGVILVIVVVVIVVFLVMKRRKNNFTNDYGGSSASIGMAPVSSSYPPSSTSNTYPSPPTTRAYPSPPTASTYPSPPARPTAPGPTYSAPSRPAAPMPGRSAPPRPSPSAAPGRAPLPAPPARGPMRGPPPGRSPMPSRAPMPSRGPMAPPRNGPPMRPTSPPPARTGAPRPPRPARHPYG